MFLVVIPTYRYNIDNNPKHRKTLYKFIEIIKLFKTKSKFDMS